MVEGEWAGGVTGLGDQRVEIAMLRTPDGHSRLELSRFIVPAVVADHRNAPVNALGYLRAMFTVSDIDDTLARLRKHGAKLVGEVVQYENAYRLCYIRGPEGILIGLAEPRGPEVLVTADDITRGKPDPEPYLLAAERLGVAPERCVVVEDAPAGVQAAKAAGMTAIGVATTHAATVLAQADVVLDSMVAVRQELGRVLG